MYNLGETICLKKKYGFPGVAVVVVMLLNLWNTPTPINKKKNTKMMGKQKNSYIYIYCKIIASLLQKYQRVTLCFLMKIQWKLYGN